MVRSVYGDSYHSKSYVGAEGNGDFDGEDGELKSIRVTDVCSE